MELNLNKLNETASHHAKKDIDLCKLSTLIPKFSPEYSGPKQSNMWNIMMVTLTPLERYRLIFRLQMNLGMATI